MVVFPNCKINIGLNITSKRSDGFHNLETVFYPVHWTDVLEVVSKPEELSVLQVSGITIDGDNADNICLKAYHLLKQDFPQIQPVNIYLHKSIPTGAGLGGGSADGAFMLKLLNDKFNLGLTEKQLVAYALQLGSDCPFFILNEPCFATGRGEQMTPVTLSLLGYTLILVNPGIHINTGWAFSNIKVSVPAKSIKEIIEQPIETWKAEVINDFEFPVFQSFPEIAEIKQKLYNEGAVFASMSGSGSTVFGLFKPGVIKEIQWPSSYTYKTIGLK